MEEANLSDNSHLELLKSRSLLGLILDESSIQSLLLEHPALSAQKDAKLCTEGTTALNLIIVLEGNATLTSSKSHAKIGDVSPGRSINLHSVVRKLPFQYDAIVERECSYISIPWKKIQHYIQGNPKLDAYLHTITSSPEARRISKDLDQAGCSSQFRIRFIGCLESRSIPAQQWLVQEKEIPTFSFFHIDGAIHTFQTKSGGTSVPLWEIPKLSWQMLSECAFEKQSLYAYRTLVEARLLIIEKVALIQLREEFSEDLERLLHWMSHLGKQATEETSEEGEEVDSLAELFPDTHLPRTGRFKKYPFVAQYNQMDCGPACMAMISKYYGNELPIQFWRDQIGPTREGSSMFDIARAAEKTGFIAHGVSVEDLAGVEKELFPCIALRQYHFVVVYAVKGEKVTVGDPGAEVVELLLSDFMEGFENSLLLLKPGPEFFELKVPLKGTAHYLNLFKGHGREIFLTLLCSSLLVIFSLFPPILSQLILDEVLSKKDLKLLVVVLVAGVAVALSKALLTWIRSYYLAYVTTKFDFRASSGFVRKMFSLPYSFYATRHVGDFTRRLMEMERVRQFFTSTLITVLIEIFTLVFYAAVLISYSTSVAVATFCLAPILVAISMIFSKRLKKNYSTGFVVRSELESLIADQIKGIATIKTMGAELSSRWRYEERLVRALKADYRFVLNAKGMESITDSYNQIARFLLMGYAAFLGVKGDLSPGQVVAISMIVSSVMDPFLMLAHAWAGVQEVRVILDRLNDVFLAPSEVSDKRRKFSKEKFSGEIEFKDVWFRYGGESSDWVLKGLSFKVSPGQNIAIVGESGSGKSTIAALLGRIYEPQKGQVLLDGRDVRDYDLQWLRQQIGFLHQESNLFHGTVAENIAFNTPKFNITDVENAARMADAYDFIQKKGNGFDYVIAHGGLGLSGGEKQRISLARTVFSGASILVLDEATSALDGISERKLLENIRNRFRGQTILSIAHRYTTVTMSDFALVISNGRCVGFGTHEELLNGNGVYATLFGFSKGDVELEESDDLAS